MPVAQNRLPQDMHYIPEDVVCGELPAYTPISRLSDSFSESMRMMSEIQKLREALPGIDCGACGSPTCRAFAEDVVRGSVKSIDLCVCLKKSKTEEQK